MPSSLNWGIISTGRIAGTFAQGLKDSKTGRLVAVASRSLESARAFGEKWNVTSCYGSYAELLADPQVQAVYIATPHPQHAEWAIKAAEAGKHILCEKPLTINAGEAMAVVEAAREHNVVLMEAFMYRCHPQTERLVDIIRSGDIGEVKLIQATFSFHAGFNPESRLFSNALAGGGILDVGCYAASMARLIAGAAQGKDFADPIEVSGAGHLGETNVDEYAVATLKFPGDIVAQLSTGVRLNQDNSVRIYGTEGWIHVPSPWMCTPTDGAIRFTVHAKGQAQDIVIEADRSLYAYEADVFATAVEANEVPSPAMSPEDSLGNMATLDLWRAAIRLTYESETPSVQKPVRGTLKRRLDNKMRYVRIKGLDKDIARLFFGCDNQRTYSHAAAVFDDYYERGGNGFDTAYIYGGGLQERLLGQWVKARGLREQVAIIVKGAHTPHCNPEALTSQLYQSLDRLGTDYADIYMMHRDNPDIPVSEFVDVLNEHLQAGRIKVFGGSNWSIERVQAANEYAASKGLVGFGALSNNFSLARMVDPVWHGCISASDAASRAWLTEHQIPVFAWSSQARGFFVRAAKNFTEDEELVRCWYSEDNFQRLERARELALKKGTTPINIAAAYVLAQPFPIIALIGPRNIAETRSSMGGLDVELTPEEVRWLNLEA
jgi:predicted dehydrogenase/aryl-alcohol dehydrogenase-like predicted oxidoreductase